jgi:hypothetical protein
VDRIEPIAPDRSVQRVDLTYLTPLEREREKERRERERRRRAAHAVPSGTPHRAPDSPSGTPHRAPEPPSGTAHGARTDGPDDAPPRLDVRA